MGCIIFGSAKINQWSVVQLSAPVSGINLLLPPDKQSMPGQRQALILIIRLMFTWC